MPIKRARSGGFGQGNRNFPLWDLGCEAFWRSQNPTVVQCPGGVTTPTYVMNDGTPQGAPYLAFDPARRGGAFFRISNAAIEMPRCGQFSRTRTNYWNTTEANDRGLPNLQTNLTRSNSDAIAAGYILEPHATWPIAGTHGQCKLTNGGAGWRYNSGQNATTTTSQPKVWAFLCKMSDGSAVTYEKIVPVISVANPAAGAFTNLAAYQQYIKIRSDGWYLVTGKTTSTATDLYYSVGVAVGLSAWIEAPNLILTSSGVPEAGWIWGTTSSDTNKLWRESYLTMNRGVSGTAQETYPANGWLACSMLNPWGGFDTGLVSARYVCWEVNADNRIYIGTASTYDIVGACYSGGGSSQFWLHDATWTIGKCIPYGIVLAWESRESAQYARLFINGVCVGTDISFSLPVGNPTTITVGKESAGIGADCWVQHVAVGRRGLSGAEAQRLSLWLQSKVLHTF